MESLFPLTIDPEPVTAGPTAFQLNKLSLFSSPLPLCDLPFLLCLAFRLVTLTWRGEGGLSHVPCNWKHIHRLKPYLYTGREREFRYALLLQLFGGLRSKRDPRCRSPCGTGAGRDGRGFLLTGEEAGLGQLVLCGFGGGGGGRVSIVCHVDGTPEWQSAGLGLLRKAVRARVRARFPITTALAYLSGALR